jgi:phage terminase small subunit
MRGRKPDITPDPEALTAGTKPPVWLSADAKKEWKRVLPILCARQILTAAAVARMIEA